MLVHISVVSVPLLDSAKTQKAKTQKAKTQKALNLQPTMSLLFIIVALSAAPLVIAEEETPNPLLDKPNLLFILGVFV